jgi:hypothetical protein
MNKLERVGTKTWGRDHYSLLLYLESCAVDKKGVVDDKRLRINADKRGFGNGLGTGYSTWKPTYGTQYQGSAIPDPNHDDLDVLEDLEDIDWVKNLGTEVNPFVSITDAGRKVVSLVRDFRAKGGQLRDFVYGA